MDCWAIGRELIDNPNMDTSPDRSDSEDHSRSALDRMIDFTGHHAIESLNHDAILFEHIGARSVPERRVNELDCSAPTSGPRSGPKKIE